MIERSISKLVVPKKRERFIENEFVEIWSENGIVFQKIKPGVVMDITAGQQIVKDRMSVSDQIIMPTLIDLCHLIHIDIETRTFLASEAAQRYLSAGAFLMDNILNRLLVNAIIKFDNSFIPLEGFTDKAKALTWLERFKNLN